MKDVIVDVRNLSTGFDTEGGHITVLDKISFSIRRGETLGIVGESGCGKSVTSLSIMRLLPKPAGKITGGEILFEGKDLTKVEPDEMRHIRGNRVSMIFQEPMTALNPVHTVGQQLSEVFELHSKEMLRGDRENASVEILKAVGIPDPQKRLRDYPHQLSGGIRQRVMIAMALACKPDLLIADEPTTALDVTIQAQILKLMKDMQQKFGTAIMFITHDLGVIAELCEQVVVMYAGRIAEKGSALDLFKLPRHPYTKGLLHSIPRLDHPSKTKLNVIEGMVPDLYSLPKGCRFENRCPYRIEKCKIESPDLVEIGAGHFSACFRAEELGGGAK